MMKKFIMVGIMAGAIFSQDPISVSNVPGAAADFDDLQSALDQSAEGSIIYVYGSSDSYGHIVLTKPVSLFGAGMFSNTPNLSRSKVASVSFSFYQADSSSGSSITGFEVATSISVSSDLHDIRIERNIGKQITLSDNYDIYIVNNYLNYPNAGSSSIIISMTESENVTILNNYFYISGYISSTNNVSCISGSNAFISNNYMFCDNEHPSFPFEILTGSSMVAENNIFAGDANGFSDVSNTQFRNNIYHSELPLGQNFNSGTGNIVGAPVFESAEFGTMSFQQLGFGSPGLDGGTDGTDIGIQGGVYSFQNAYMPPLPFVQYMNVPAIAPANSTIEVEIIGKSHN
jgi:hypothetical protein